VQKIDEQWQLDLIDFSNLSKYNNNFKYLLVVIDVLSKFVWVEKLYNKSAQSIVEAFQKVIKLSNRKPQFIFSDPGSKYIVKISHKDILINFFQFLEEFDNSLFAKLCRKEKITHFFSRNTETKAPNVERVIRTLKEKIYKYFTFKNSYRYIDELKFIVDSYNNSVHSRTKFKPSDVNINNQEIVFLNLYKNILSKPTKVKFHESDIVQIQKLKTPFDKGFTPNWQNELFKIDKIIHSLPHPRYKVKDFRGENIVGSFYQEELQKVRQQK
jgi:hypothetical protein